MTAASVNASSSDAWSITVDGRTIDMAGWHDSNEIVEVACKTTCSSGDPFVGRWRGPPVLDLYETVSPDVTHFVLASDDDFQVCVDVATAIDGIVAIERLDGPPNGLPRFVAPGLGGTRMIKHVRRIDTHCLEPGDDPADLEHLYPS